MTKQLIMKMALTLMTASPHYGLVLDCLTLPSLPTCVVSGATARKYLIPMCKRWTLRAWALGPGWREIFRGSATISARHATRGVPPFSARQVGQLCGVFPWLGPSCNEGKADGSQDSSSLLPLFLSFFLPLLNSCRPYLIIFWSILTHDLLD